MRRFRALLVIAACLFLNSVYATVGGPLVIEILGVNPDSTRLYWTYHFHGESDELFPVIFYSTEKDKLQERHGWSSYPDEPIEESFTRYRRKFQLDSSNRSTNADYSIAYLDSSYHEDTVNWLPYPIFSYTVTLPNDTIVVHNCGHKDYVPRILRSYQLKQGVVAHLCRFMGIAMEGGYTKDTIIIFDPRNFIDSVVAYTPDTSGLPVPFDKIESPGDHEQPGRSIFAWIWWSILLMVVSTFLFIFIRNKRKKGK